MSIILNLDKTPSAIRFRLCSIMASRTFQVAEAVDVKVMDSFDRIVTGLKDGTLDKETVLSYMRVLEKIIDVSERLDIDLSSYMVDGELDHFAWFSAVANHMSGETLARVQKTCVGCEDNPLLSDCLAVVKAELSQRTPEGWS